MQITESISCPAVAMVFGFYNLAFVKRMVRAVLGTTLVDNSRDTYGWRRGKTCAACGRQFVPMYRCMRCHTRRLCGRECQEVDWRQGHKFFCRLTSDERFAYEVRDFGEVTSETVAFRESLLGRGDAGISSAVFARIDLPTGYVVMPLCLDEFRADWHPCTRVGTTSDATRANCEWATLRRPGGRGRRVSENHVALKTTRAVSAGERLVADAMIS